MAIHGSLWARRLTFAILLAAVCVLGASQASAQDGDQSSFFGPLVKRVVLDPTTYAPSIITYDATMRDWNSSQPFFRSGLFVERNPRFTVSGRPNDVPLDYAAGKRQILMDAFANLEISVVNNAADAVFERMLTQRYPEHRKLFRVLGRVERIGFASYLSYRLAAPHYRQWQANEQMGKQIGFLVSVPIH